MTQPDYTQKPFAPEVHQERSSSDISGMDQNTASGLRGKLIESILQLVVQAITGVFVPGGLGGAFAQLTDWAFNLLPAQILAPLQDLVNALITLLGHIPIVGPIITQLADMFGFLNDNTTTAQGSANTANSEIAALKAQIDAGTSGALITDTFDRAADTGPSGLGGNWNQTYDSGSGTYGTDGAGKAHWTEAGGGTRTCMNRYSALALNTDFQIIRFVLADAMRNYTFDPNIALCGRMNAAEDTWVQATVWYNGCEIGYIVSGSYTRIGSSVGITSNAGDIWELKLGVGTTGDDPYTFVLSQNTTTVCTRIDTGHVSQRGASYLYSAVQAHAGAAVVGFSSAQRGPSDMNVFTATDYVP